MAVTGANDNPVPATIYLDGVKIGQALLHKRGLKPGNHVVEARHPGYKTRKKKVTLSAGPDSNRVVFRLEKE